MIVEALFLALPIEHKCQRIIDTARKIDERGLFNLAFDILQLRSDVEDLPLLDSLFNLDGPDNTIIQMSLAQSISDIHKIDAISIAFVHEQGHGELLKISRLRPRGRRGGHQAFVTEWKPIEFQSKLLGRTIDLSSPDDDKLNPVELEPFQIMELARLLWTSYRMSPPESEYQA